MKGSAASIFNLTLAIACGFCLFSFLRPVFSSCADHNYCNGHGTCVVSTATCECFEGWGADSDIATYKRPDCAERICPSGRAWGDIATASDTAHALAECSNRGECDRTSGTCTCFEGFEGESCQRMKCPSQCSGHGRCMSMKQMALIEDALPLSAATTYSGDSDTTTWDEDMVHGCVCDSSWAVGLGSGQTQTPEWFGADCSLRHCPSGNDPNTAADETDCTNSTATGGFGTGASGNLCHVDCSNRGLCDYKTGLCECFVGYYGENCGSISALAGAGEG